VDKIDVAILEQDMDAAAMTTFLAMLTQRGHELQNAWNVFNLYSKAVHLTNASSVSDTEKRLSRLTALPHGTLKRFSTVTVAIVGASRRFLQQARTHQVGFNYMSGSLQYSDHTEVDVTAKERFVVPYALLEKDYADCTVARQDKYLRNLQSAYDAYSQLIKEGLDHDTAAYVLPMATRNVLIMQGNFESWQHFIKLRCCRRNTDETRYVATRIWHELACNVRFSTAMLAGYGPDCLWDGCKEGALSCKSGFKGCVERAPRTMAKHILTHDWPLLYKEAGL
jgi:thymidylate synthase (FAD)